MNRVPPAKRGIAMVFQSYALYPHLTVRDNMALALKQEGQNRETIEDRVAEVTRILNLDDYLDRRPAELSGGQRQRVAIGRVIVQHPKVFRFDEPLSNLDAALRMNTRLEIAKLHRTLQASMIYVTHDQTEAMTLADKIVVLRDGRVEQVGSPMDLYNTPVNQFVAGFLGAPSMNFLSGTKVGGDGQMTCGIRPEHLTIAAQGLLSGAVTHVEKLGGDTNAIVDLGDGDQITVRFLVSTPSPPMTRCVWLLIRPMPIGWTARVFAPSKGRSCHYSPVDEKRGNVTMGSDTLGISRCDSPVNAQVCPMAPYFDEMGGPDDPVRPPYKNLQDWFLWEDPVRPRAQQREAEEIFDIPAHRDRL